MLFDCQRNVTLKHLYNFILNIYMVPAQCIQTYTNQVLKILKTSCLYWKSRCSKQVAKKNWFQKSTKIIIYHLTTHDFGWLAIPIWSADKLQGQTAEKAPIEFQTNQHGISLGWSLLGWAFHSAAKKNMGLKFKQGLFIVFCRGFLPTSHI